MADAVAAVRRAAKAERAAEKTREEGERDWRQAWWVTTMALAAVPATPQPNLTEATNAVVEALGHSRKYVGLRRACGKHLFLLEEEIRSNLIPRFAIAATQAKADPQTAAELILQAEHEGCSLREFSAMLTGQSWTKAPENMTPEERLHVARTEIKQRPHEVLKDDKTREAADEASLQIRASQPRPRITDEYADHVVNQAGKSMADRMGIEIPLEHLDASAGEIASALHARTVHGVRDKKSWNRKLDEIHRMEVMAREDDESWTEEDQELLRSFSGGN
jgi:hypothetical protein